MLELFASKNIHFHAICIQESWIHDDSKLPLVALEGYQCFSIKATTSSHGGLITYMDDKYHVQVKKTVDDSNIWEGLFLELNHSSFQNKIIIGNVYKPPRDNNSARNINAFKSEIEPILQEIGISNNEALICGDYNINLLKIKRRSSFFRIFRHHAWTQLLLQNNFAYSIKSYKWSNTNRQHILQIVVSNLNDLCRNNS